MLSLSLIYLFPFIQNWTWSFHMQGQIVESSVLQALILCEAMHGFFSLETGLKFSLRLLLKKLNKWKYVVCKCREKDNLWQQTDRLTYEQKMQSTAKWMDEKSVTHCLGCKTEFTFMVRKVHVVIFWFTIFFLPYIKMHFFV